MIARSISGCELGKVEALIIFCLWVGTVGMHKVYIRI